MPAHAINDTIFRGDTYRGTGQVLTDNAAALTVDLTGWTLWFTVKRSTSDLDADALFLAETGDGSGGATITDASAGEYSWAMPADKTTSFTSPVVLYVDIQVRDPAGNVATVAFGTVRVTPDVTRAIAP